MSKVEIVATTVRLDAQMSEALSQFRREQDDLPTPPRAIKRILKDWLIGNGYIALEEDDEQQP